MRPGWMPSPHALEFSSAIQAGTQHLPLCIVLGSRSTLLGCEDLAEDSTQREVLGGKAKSMFSGS